MNMKEFYHLAELAGELVEYEGAGPVNGRVFVYSDKDEIRSVFWENLEAVMESIDAEPVDVLGTQYSGEHIANELKPHREVFYFDYPGGRIEVNGKKAQSRISVLKDLSEGYGIEEAIDTHYSDPETLEKAGIDIKDALDDDDRLEEGYSEDLKQIMEIKRDKGQAPFGDSSGDP
jgi:hypothetical protein